MIEAEDLEGRARGRRGRCVDVIFRVDDETVSPATTPRCARAASLGHFVTRPRSKPQHSWGNSSRACARSTVSNPFAGHRHLTLET
jgi:hypothetical protein